MNRGILSLLLVILFASPVLAQDPSKTDDSKKQDDRPITKKLMDDAKDSKNIGTTLEILFLLTVLSLAPAILLMTTCFIRIVVVLAFVRRALATQEMPPNQVLIGLALIMTFMVMTPTIEAIKRDALDPYTREIDPIPQEVAFEISVHHVRKFMFMHVRYEDLYLFMEVTRQPKKKEGWTEEDVPTLVLIPAFVISELRRAFIMGFALFLPFLVIDMVVASTLISMGMLVLPPILISLPFKILLFILVDGWNLVVGSLIESFY